MNIVLFDTAHRDLLFPLSLTRPVADLRFGIFTAKERWQLYFSKEVQVLTEDYLAPKFGKPADGDTLFINAAWIPSVALKDRLLKLDPGQSIWSGSRLIAGRTDAKNISHFDRLTKDAFNVTEDVGDKECFIQYPWDLLFINTKAIADDISLLGLINGFQTISSTNTCINPGHIYIEEGAVVEHCILNATEGPIYIAKNCVVMEGTMIRGPFAMGEGSILKMGTKVYGATSLGPGCTVGGEIKNVIMQAYSNKAHDGYLGDSVIGEFCNLGAGTSCSNVKNTAGDIKVWVRAIKNYKLVGNKCGVFMGDHTRCAINTSINSGTVIGVCNNVFGEGLTPKHIRDFSWGLKENLPYNFEKAISDCNNWMVFKKTSLSANDKKILKHIYDNR
jgi:UDP-N-acetylglucosamine diphosphorylase/glucosamine-1-phosphate N-acetyltransferase